MLLYLLQNVALACLSRYFTSLDMQNTPRQVFLYGMMNVQPQGSQTLEFAHGPSVYNECFPVFVAQEPFRQYMSLGSLGPYVQEPMPVVLDY